MGYNVQDVSRSPAVQRDLADFLATFVQDGELPSPLPGDDRSDVWLKRFLWWWDQNPFCREDSPRGFVLYTEK
ncbi:MAG: hypothetical protein AAF357_05175, partial [Verrucomicrobiota bacterium]